MVSRFKRADGSSMTLREAGERHGQSVGLPQFVGTPEQVADQMEAFIEQVGGDGFMLSAIHTPGAIEAFVDEVVPTLQQRGRVRTEYRGETMREILREIEAFVGDRPATPEEIATIRNRDVRSLPGRFETNAAVSGAIAEMVVFDRPDDYVRTLKQRIEAQTDEAVRAAARASLETSRLTWVVVGDLKVIEQPIRDLGVGPVSVLDSDGRVLR